MICKTGALASNLKMAVPLTLGGQLIGVHEPQLAFLEVAKDMRWDPVRASHYCHFLESVLAGTRLAPLLLEVGGWAGTEAGQRVGGLCKGMRQVAMLHPGLQSSSGGGS